MSENKKDGCWGIFFITMLAASVLIMTFRVAEIDARLDAAGIPEVSNDR